MAPMSSILLMLSAFSCADAASHSAVVLKIGGHMQADYRLAFMKWVDWTNSAAGQAALTAGAGGAYTVDVANLKTYVASDTSVATMKAEVAAMTTSGDATLVHTVLCPYSSGLSKDCVDSVAVAYTGPVMIFGGASDSIFDTDCVRLRTNNGCFGMLTPASQYTLTGLAALDAKIANDPKAKVLIVSNANAFSLGVANGALAYIATGAGATGLQNLNAAVTQITVQKTALTDADKATIATEMAKSPDFVVIAGHNGDVEPVIVQIGKMNATHWPKGILAVNGLTNMANYGTDTKYAQYTLMPTQWARAATVDPIVGWNSAAFLTAMGGAATYQQASAAAVGIALANAMAEDGVATLANVLTNMKALSAKNSGAGVPSFYGVLKWDATTGKSQKPMYTEQLQGTERVIVAPTGTLTYPLAPQWTATSPWTVKIGGHVQATYHSAVNLWATWANAQTGADRFTVTSTVKTYDAATLVADIGAMTTPGNAAYVDVVYCPYGSAIVKTCVDAVYPAYKGPVMISGGAADSIFDTNCAALPNKNCYGMLTVASKYTESGLKALDALLPDPAKVLVITNNNDFSKSVATGALATVASQAGLTLQGATYSEISVSKTALTDADKAIITAAMGLKPDVVVVTGHNLDVEPAIIQIASVNGSWPKGIIAVNGLTQLANYGDHSNFARCTMMPTQWDSTTSLKDPVIGWDSMAVTAALGGAATYQQAAHVAAGVALANAMAATKDKTRLRHGLSALNVASFYGQLQWDVAGKIQKPMFTEQLQRYGTSKMIVAPTGAAITQPISGASCWAASPEYSTLMRIGGHIQDTYKAPIKAFADWANAKTGTGAYRVLESMMTYNASTMAADVKSMTTVGHPMYVDALVCPYSSGIVKACVDAVNHAFTGPVMIFGGASDSIYDTNCQALPNKNCFSTLTVASQYTMTGLTALKALMGNTTSSGKVVIISNSNAFSKSVAAATVVMIDATDGLDLTAKGANQTEAYTEISAQKTALTDADKTLITNAMAIKPDIVVITGHNKDVEPAIIHIGKMSEDHRPKAILAVNGLSQLANYGTDKMYSKCVMMPTQWDASTTDTDPIIGWSSAAFKTALGGSATYQEAAAGAIGVSLANAMNASMSDGSFPALFNRATSLKTSLRSMNNGTGVKSFYGLLKWDAKGKIEKPMYTQQLQGENLVIVAPTGKADYPLSSEKCWAAGSSGQVSGTRMNMLGFGFLLTVFGIALI